jgi:hypothetical protein|tara:strand:- start:722 stop:847 length:126 start_codon:yes stop_codon:yes gene_type:complete
LQEAVLQKVIERLFKVFNVPAIYKNVCNPNDTNKLIEMALK